MQSAVPKTSPRIALPRGVCAAAELLFRERFEPEVLPTGISGIDGLIRGIPRGAITEIFGGASSGRTSLMYAIAASAALRREYCALVDATDSFDPASAAGVDLKRLLWIRCAGNAEHALKAVDLLVNGGGFGIVLMDLAGVPPNAA